MVQVYVEPIARRHYAPFVSVAFLYRPFCIGATPLPRGRHRVEFEASSWIQNVTPLETTLEMSRLPSLTFFSPRLSVPFVPHPPPQSSR